MDDDRRDEDERRLQALFDETASPPSHDVLQRMARRAAQIPEQHQPWYRRLAWGRPLIGTAALAAAALALYFVVRDEAPVTSTGGAPSQTSPEPDESDGDIDELLAFELHENGGDEVLDPDPLGGFEDDVLIAGDHPVAALEVLFSEEEDMDALQEVIEDVLKDGG